MRIIIFIWLLFGSHINLYNQIKFDYSWIVGESYSKVKGTDGTIIDFNYKPLKTYYQTNSSPQTLLAIGEICDKITGRLLFYTNGCIIFDSTHHIMQNGDSLNYGEYWENYCTDEYYRYYPNGLSLIALPDNYIDDKYYLIHQLEVRSNNKIRNGPIALTKVRYSLDFPNGIVEKKNIPIVTEYTASGFMTAMLHENKKDWWIVHLLDESNKYVKLLLDSTGLHIKDYQVIGDSIYEHHAQAQFSPDGKMFAWYNQERGLQLFDFDRATGQLSNHRSLKIDYKKRVGGLCFSPNSRFLYLMHNDKVFQVDLTNSDLSKSYEVIGEYIYNVNNDTIEYQTFLFGMLGPDCKIYITATNATYYFTTIENPDEKGKACNFKNLGLKLIYSKTIGAIPNFPHFRVDEPYPCDKTISSSIYPKIHGLQVYPSPANNLVKIQVPAKGMLSIYDVNGRSLYQKMYYHEIIEEVDVSNFSIGLYTVVFEEEYKVYKGEFVKQ